MIDYGVKEVAPGKWRATVAFTGEVTILDLDGGVLPEEGFTPWPSFDSKEQAEAFVRGLREQEAQ